MNWQALAIKAGRIAEKVLRKWARKKHEETVNTINRNRVDNKLHNDKAVRD